MNLTIDPAPDRVRLELSGRLESDVPPVVVVREDDAIEVAV